MNRMLELGGQAAGTAQKPDLSIIVMGHSPLRPVVTRILTDHTGGRFPNPEGIIGAVHPVVHIVIHKCLLVLHITRTSIIGSEKLFFISVAVTIGVGEFIDIILIGIHGQYGVLSIGQHKAGKNKAVNENRSCFIDTVIIGILPS